MKIYTKTGDKGATGTLKGRISKSDELAAAIGTVDELNSHIGLIRGELIHDLRFTVIEEELHRMQNNLLTIGAILAGAGLTFSKQETTRLEKLIDKLSLDLPKLTNFIFPTGPNPVGQIHIARTVARRAERVVVAASVQNKNILAYLNRLSDAQFVIARWLNLKLGREEELWRK